MRVFFLTAMIVVLVFPISGQTIFRLSGEHLFKRDGAESWSISRKEIDPKNGKSKLKKNFARGNGNSVKLNFKQAGKKETIYYITFRGKGFTETKAVRIFDPEKLTSFLFQTKSNPAIRTYLFIPGSLNAGTQILYIMHGMKRRPDKYITAWEKWAAENNYILVGPTFDLENWIRARSYNFGNMFTGNGGKGDLNPSSKWSYRIVEDLFAKLRTGFALENDYFHMYGHSAGAQFIHRFTFFIPDTKVKIAISANSGWYTLPALEKKYPYGLKHPKLSYSEKDLQNWSKKRLIIMRGTADVLRSKQVRKTKEADEQGQNRFERAGFMFNMMRESYPQTNWRLINVPNVAHSQAKMSFAAQRVLERLEKEVQD